MACPTRARVGVGSRTQEYLSAPCMPRDKEPGSILPPPNYVHDADELGENFDRIKPSYGPPLGAHVLRFCSSWELKKFENILKGGHDLVET